MDHCTWEMIQTSFFPQPEKDKPIKIIQIAPSGFQPRKVEELLPNIDILKDTYMIYPTGGYHPFYGVLNTFPRYQLPVWPYIKRIKYDDGGKGRGRRHPLNFQANIILSTEGYPIISLQRTTFRSRYTTSKKKSYRAHKDTTQLFHRLVALAWIPNPEKKKNACHINDDKSNFLIENLKWGTASENSRGKIKKRPDTLEQKYLALVDKGIIKG